MPGAFSSKPYLLFDLDGTLVDSTGAHARAYVQTLETTDPLLAKNFNYAPFAGQPTRQVFRALGFSEEPELTDLTQRKQAAYREAIERGEVAVFPGVPELLGQLVKANRSLYIVTGASRHSAERILDRAKLRHYFSGVVAGEDTALGKPAPDPYVYVMSQFHLGKRDCLAIEDAESGILSARAAGLDAILLHQEWEFPGVPSVRDPAQLAALLLE
jgi:HAD superfamily hydrolase (TIGR01509 family)